MENDQQSKTSIAAIARACRLFRSHSHMSMVTGIHSTTISELLSGARQPTATQAALIAQHTGGKVKRHEIRPDLYPSPGVVPSAYHYDTATKFEVEQRHRAAAKAGGVGPKPARRRPAVTKGSTTPAKKVK